MPTSPSTLDKKKLAPTSGQYPILVSGIAKTVFSVAILKLALIDSPTPPPTNKERSVQEVNRPPRPDLLVMPSITATYGCGTAASM